MLQMYQKKQTQWRNIIIIYIMQRSSNLTSAYREGLSEVRLKQEIVCVNKELFVCHLKKSERESL